MPRERVASVDDRPRWRRAVSSPWFHLLAAVVVLALAQAFVVKLYRIPSVSMEQTLDVGDRILVNRLAFLGSAPAAGDVVVFDASAEWDAAEGRTQTSSVWGWIGDVVGLGPSNAHTLVKRVVATAGQTVRCCDADGHLLVDDEPVAAPFPDEDFPFVSGVQDCETSPPSSRCLPEITVPPGTLLVMGDNRSDSSDSVVACRGLVAGGGDGCARFVDVGDVVGPVLLRVWPLDRFGAVGP